MTDTPLLDAAGLRTAAMPLWAGNAPGALGTSLLDQPILTVHAPDLGKSNGCAVIVNPGGGYRILASDHEGLQVARWLNGLGITAFVLRYRVGPRYHSRISLLDGLRAVRVVRSQALRYSISEDRIGMLGFSAGGHLCVAVGTGWDSGDAAAVDPVERCSSRPDFLVPVYAVTNGHRRGRKADEYPPADVRVGSGTPPSFIVHTHEDRIVPATQSTLFYDALLAAGVDAELHVFNDGEHGLGLMPGDPDVQQWTHLLHRWLRRRGFLTREPRVAVEGRVTIDGKAAGMVWLTLIPDADTHPLARVRVAAASGGDFTIARPQGPIAGPHRLDVHHVSDLVTPVATGIYTLADARLHSRRVEVVAGRRLLVDVRAEDFEPR